jgi:4-diphosphocytidyl-2-C-methyl-D-erythritol kinase
LSKGRGRTRRLELRAAAKVNLGLEIIRRRDDGYHEIATVMQAVDLSDRIILEDAPVLDLRVTSAAVPHDRSNLAMRAATALREAAGVDRGASITLDKRIPVAAGLGGGSTDAAAVLMGLNRLWRLGWRTERLEELAVGLGMDVPFFLRGGAAMATARGERLVPITGGQFALVLVNPGSHISAAEAYGAVTPAHYSDGERVRQVARLVARRQPAKLGESLYNALEGAVAPSHPEIARMEAALRAAGALGAAMSGSGPTVFGIVRSFEHARQVRARVVRGDWSCWAVKALRGPAVRIHGGSVR